MKLKLILLVICFLVASLAILYLYNQKSQPKFGLEYNAERQKLGIPTIPPSWSFMVNDYDTTWFDPQGAEKRDNHIPYHASKEVITQNEVLASEIDTYFGAIDYHDIFSNTLQRERITITYYYQGNNWFAS